MAKVTSSSNVRGEFNNYNLPPELAPAHPRGEVCSNWEGFCQVHASANSNSSLCSMSFRGRGRGDGGGRGRGRGGGRGGRGGGGGFGRSYDQGPPDTVVGKY